MNCVSFTHGKVQCYKLHKDGCMFSTTLVKLTNRHCVVVTHPPVSMDFSWYSLPNMYRGRNNGSGEYNVPWFHDQRGPSKGTCLARSVDWFAATFLLQLQKVTGVLQRRLLKKNSLLYHSSLGLKRQPEFMQCSAMQRKKGNNFPCFVAEDSFEDLEVLVDGSRGRGEAEVHSFFYKST